MSEDFWTASPCGFENSVVQTYGSMSSACTLTHVHDKHSASCSNKPSEFINHGLLLWTQTRQTWLEKKNSKRRARQLLEPKLSWNETYDAVLGSNKLLRKPIPLSEMVDFLVDIWEQEGLYD